SPPFPLSLHDALPILLRFPRGLPGPFRSSLSGTVPCTWETAGPVASPRLRSKMASNLLGAFVCDFIQEFSPHLLILFPPLLSIRSEEHTSELQSLAYL